MKQLAVVFFNRGFGVIDRGFLGLPIVTGRMYAIYSRYQNDASRI